ncbi:MAG: class I SAM-dependent methyltransferase [Halioglobus sp.]|nr:class I SAM-dependent methyltransferase [Halioglobus sp.]
MSTIRACLLATSLALTGATLPVYAGDNSAALAEVVAARSDEDKARDGARHPVETLEFFQVEPGMTVAEGLPGGGWYTRILANYLGADGALYGVNYADRMWPMFSFSTPEMIATRTAATANFPAEVATYTDNGITARGFTFETVPPEVVGTVDRVLLIRALHNLNRYEGEAQTLSRALANVRSMLKDDGLVGVVQHRAPETASAEWADGSRGYLNEAAVIVMFEEAGFELVAQSDINANPLDQPAGDDNVWRLPPSLRGNSDDPKKQAEMAAIGESDRMTLLFRKAP